MVKSIYRYVKSLPYIDLNNINYNLKINDLNNYIIIQKLYSNFIFGYFTFIYYNNKENLKGNSISKLPKLDYIIDEKINFNELDFLIKNIYDNESIIFKRFCIQYYIKNPNIKNKNFFDNINNYKDSKVNPLKYKKIGIDYGGLLKQFFLLLKLI